MTGGNHIGDVTHHQDQVATSPIFANFNVKNNKNRKIGILTAILSFTRLLLSIVLYFN